MRTRFLSTMFHRPIWRAGSVSRPRLLAQIQAGLEARGRLTLIVAPAGYGKTTLLAEWLSERMKDEDRRMKPSEGSPDHPSSLIPHPSSFAWLALDAGHNDPARFLGAWVAALQGVDPALGQGALALLQQPQPAPPTAVLDELLNDLAERRAPLGLVLDDYHVIRNPQLHEALEYTIRHLPAQAHLVLVSRELPPFPLARLRVQGQLTELYAQDLRFTLDEARQLFRQSIQIDVSDAVIQTLEARTEGWAAGLQLAGLALQRQPDPQDFVATFGGSHRYIIDYLLDEVLRQQPPAVRAFLSATAPLARFCADLAQAVTGSPDAAAILAQLDQANLFLIPLDDQRIWYRYHHLFADVLRATLTSEVERAARTAAACWFEDQGLLGEAITLWLELSDTAAAARLLNSLAGDLLRAGELQTLLGWLRALPEPVLGAYPDLLAYKAFALLMLGDVRPAEVYVTQAYQGLSGEPGAAGYGRLLALQTMLAIAGGDVRTADLARAALEHLAPDDSFFRAIILFALGHYHALQADLSASGQAYRDAYRLGLQLDHRFITQGALSELASNLVEQGQLREAEALCRSVVRADAGGAERHPSLPIEAMVTIRLALIGYERGDLDVAQTRAEHGRSLSRRLFANDIMGGDSEIVLARVALLRGETAQAMALIEEALQLARQRGLSMVVSKIMAVQAELFILQGRLDAADQLLGELEALPFEPPRSTPVALLRAGYLVALDQPAPALELLSRLEPAIHAAGRVRHLIAIRLTQGLAHQQQADLVQATRCVTEALRLAAPEGYRSIFCPHPGWPTAPLLQLARHSAPAFVDSLLQLARPADAAPAPLAALLSAQELRVLDLMVAGKSNPEIAATLVIGVGTAKWHVHNILQKLGVRTRPQAIARACELGAGKSEIENLKSEI